MVRVASHGLLFDSGPTPSSGRQTPTLVHGARREPHAYPARAQLWQPVLGATLIICAGFGIFSLSAFPPTQRFGLAVILGTVSAAVMTLIALPFAMNIRPDRTGDLIRADSSS